MTSLVRFRLAALSFQWDPAKAERNLRAHGITFEEAATTWLDPFAIERFDDEHSAAEDRWLRIGASLRGALLVVWSTERGSGEAAAIRIIGARRANLGERDLYGKHAKRR